MSRAMIDIIQTSGSTVSPSTLPVGISSQNSFEGNRENSATNAITGIAGGVGSVVGSLYSGATSLSGSSLYSTLSSGTILSSDSGNNSGTNAGNGPLFPPPPQGLLRVTDILKSPIPIRDANSSNFYALNERIVAAESCWFVAKVYKYIWI
jgi:hypothetical protein